MFNKLYVYDYFHLAAVFVKFDTTHLEVCEIICV